MAAIQANPGPIPELRTATVVGREALAVAATALLMPFGWFKTKTRPDSISRTRRRAEQRSVVFVHGFLANSSCFAAMSAYLRLAGHRQRLFFSYRPTDSVERAAIDLKRFLKHHVRGGRVDLVCHSLGGLVATCYMAELGGARRVDHCIMLGTPHRGTYNAYWLLGRVARDLRPNSALLRRLGRSKSALRGVKLTTILAGSDNIVLPRLEATPSRGRIVVDGLGHTGLLFSARVFRLVAKHLES